MDVLDVLSLQKNYSEYAVESPFDFAKHASIGCGGCAPVAFYPKSVEETAGLVRRLKEDGISYRALGNLTNVLPPDGRSSRIVVSMKKCKGISEEKGLLYVAAGVSAGELLVACKKRRLTGAEFLEGIPCTLGGALYMNAGVGGAYIGDIVENVTAIFEGKTIVLTNADCAYAYKSSVFMNDEFVILGATLRLKESNLEEIESRRAYYAARRAHLPKGRSMGCVFKNPENAVAGKLIEGAGLKGLRLGGATISLTHANFILNDKGATAAEIKAIIDIVKNAVFAQYKIRLKEEIVYLD